jgi:glucan phosphoethanolaminetransferase (alkaline phosphatase superfamily)
MLPVVLIAAADLLLRWRQLLQWTPKEFAWYAFSIAYVLVWLRISVWLLLPLRHRRALFWGAVLLQSAVSTYVLLVHFNHYLYFGVHPEVISFSQFLNETAETLRVVGAAFTPFNQALLVVLTLVLAGLWRLGLDAPLRRRAGWAWLAVGIVLLPVFHNNVQWGRGNFYPAVNFTFSASKALQFHLQGRTFRHLPLARRPEPAPLGRPLPFDVLAFVSESVRAKSMSYLAQGRKTAPREEAFFAAHPERVFQFPRCYTNSIHTNPSVPSILSGVHPLRFPSRMGRTPLLYEYGAAFPDVATFLFSAQAYETYQFQDFFRSRWLRQFVYQENSGRPPFSFGGMDDRYLLPLLRQTVDGLPPERHFIGILHFNGTHHPYRVPEGAKVWGDGTVNDKYDDALHYQDGVIGDALAQLSAARRLDHAIVMFTSDHGEGMNEHGISGHRRAYYEEFIHVPCWLFLPEALASRYGAALRANGQSNVANVDWVPTLVELMGLAEQPDVQAMLQELDGKSLLHPIDPGRVIVVHNGLTNIRVQQGFALVRGSERLLFHPVGDVGALEFYDLAQDPEEHHDLWPTLSENARREWLGILEGYPELRDEIHRAPPPGLPKPR